MINSKRTVPFCHQFRIKNHSLYEKKEEYKIKGKQNSLVSNGPVSKVKCTVLLDCDRKNCPSNYELK